MRIEDKIKKIIKKSDNIFITGHKNLDLDAIGACVGISAICSSFKKENYIIVDDIDHELGVSKILDEIKTTNNIIKSEEVKDLYKNNSILIIVDVNKAHLLQNDKILHYFNNIIILDHHQVTDQTITNTTNIIDETYSSACEIVSLLFKEYKIETTKEVATIVLSGMVLDTNNFTVKTSAKTYYAAYNLALLGANPKKVQYYLKEDLKNYIIRNKVIMTTQVVNGKYAIAVAPETTKLKREELAKIADTLLNFNEILASFVVGNRIDGGVGVSARSEGMVDVGKITGILGGGGDLCNAACQINDTTLEIVKGELLEALNKED